MKICSVENNNTFKSTFEPKPILESTFRIAKRTKNSEYIYAIKKLMNNGRNEIIDFKPDMLNNKIYQGMTLYVNGEPSLSVKGKFGITTDIKHSMVFDTMKLITIMSRITKEESYKPIKNLGQEISKIQHLIFKQK